MKKILYILSALTLLFSSCSLKEESKTEMEMQNYVRNAKEAEQVLLGVYQPMTSEYIYGYHVSLLFPLGDDQAQVEGSVTSSPREIPTNFHTPSTKEIGLTWNALYSAIYNANSFIETVQQRMPSWTPGDQQLGEYYLAEARAMRALYYFELVRWFGNVGLVTSTEESYLPNDAFDQFKPEQVLAFIETELKAAAEVLPWAADDHVRSSNAWRMSKGGVLGLLTRVYCTWAGYPVRDESKWAEAVKTAKVVVESGRHNLLPDYETLWKNAGQSVWDPTESLIEVSFYWSSKTGKEPVGMIGKWNGVITTQAGKRGTCQARQRVVYPFALKWMEKSDADNDKRFKLSIADYCYGYKSEYRYGNQTYTLIETDNQVFYQDALDYEAQRKTEISGKPVTVSEDERNKKRFANYTPAKWDVVKYNSDSPIHHLNYNSTTNWHVMRYADLLLLYAEAINETQGPTEVALAAVNAVRRRAYGDTRHDLPMGVSQEELRQAVRDERGYELCFEGQRKSDLIRWGIYYQTIRKTAQEVANNYEKGTYLVATYTREGKHELMPIPQTELDIMPKFKQNPGWGL